MKSKDQQLLEEAYKSINEEESSFFRDKPEAPVTDYKQLAAKDLEKFAFTLNNIGSRLSTAYRELHKQTTPIASEDIQDILNNLAQDGETLVLMSSEIEEIVGKLTRSEQWSPKTNNF